MATTMASSNLQWTMDNRITNTMARRNNLCRCKKEKTSTKTMPSMQHKECHQTMEMVIKHMLQVVVEVIIGCLFRDRKMMRHCHLNNNQMMQMDNKCLLRNNSQGKDNKAKCLLRIQMADSNNN